MTSKEREAALKECYDIVIDGECFRVIQEETLLGLPPVRPQEQTGHWVGIDEEPHEVWECDHCGFVIDGSGCIDPYDYRDTYKFCPNCGCRMVKSQESEDDRE